MHPLKPPILDQVTRSLATCRWGNFGFTNVSKAGGTSFAKYLMERAVELCQDLFNQLHHTKQQRQCVPLERAAACFSWVFPLATLC